MVPLLPTLDDTVGPYFPAPFAPDSSHLDLYRPYRGLNVGPMGKPIVVRIRLIDIDGRLAGSSVLEVWQPSTAGVLRVPGAERALHDDPFFEGYGRAYSPTGEFAFRTTMPGVLIEQRVERSPFMTLTIFCDGISRVVTQIFFPGTARFDTDPILSRLPPNIAQRLVVRLEGESPEGTVYAIDIKMRGEEETPFFDDQLAEQLS